MDSTPKQAWVTPTLTTLEMRDTFGGVATNLTENQTFEGTFGTVNGTLSPG